MQLAHSGGKGHVRRPRVQKGCPQKMCDLLLVVEHKPEINHVTLVAFGCILWETRLNCCNYGYQPFMGDTSSWLVFCWTLFKVKNKDKNRKGILKTKTIYMYSDMCNTPNRESPCIFRVLLESPQPASKNNATDSPGRVLATEPSPLAHGAQVSPKTALFEYHYGRNPHGTSHITKHLNAF